jgi:hypothetical protein
LNLLRLVLMGIFILLLLPETINEKNLNNVTIPQIFTRVRGQLAASAHEVGTVQVRVLIGCVFVEIVIESEI